MAPLTDRKEPNRNEAEGKGCSAELTTGQVESEKPTLQVEVPGRSVPDEVRRHLQTDVLFRA